MIQPLCTSVICLLFILALLPFDANANLAWEHHYAEKNQIVNGSSVLANSTTASFGTTLLSEFEGGAFALVAFCSADFVSYESGTTGGQSAILELTFDNESDDWVDFVEPSVSFEPSIRFESAVSDLTSAILGLDGSRFSSWDHTRELASR